jgi:hypothetical protein
LRSRSYRRPRSPPPIIQHAIWLYLRFTLSYRDVEELLAERGLGRLWVRLELFDGRQANDRKRRIVLKNS